MGTLSRRQFVVGAAGLGLLAGCGRLPWQAQQSSRAYRVGFLASSIAEPGEALLGLQQGLAELGYIDGQTVMVEYRSGEGQSGRLPALAQELIQLPVDVLVTGGPPATHAAWDASDSIPVVMVYSGDPIESGMIASLAHPGGHVTGLNTFSGHLAGKRLQLLKDASPGMSRVGIFPGRGERTALAGELRETEVAAAALGVKVISREVRDGAELEAAFEAVVSEGADAILPLTSSVLLANASAVVGLVARYRLPAMYFYRDFVDAGGLMSYATNRPSQYRRAATFVDKILKGTKPGDIPVEQPMTFDFVVNLKTAQALGITFPNEIMLQVTEVLQ